MKQDSLVPILLILLLSAIICVTIFYGQKIFKSRFIKKHVTTSEIFKVPSVSNFTISVPEKSKIDAPTDEIDTFLLNQSEKSHLSPSLSRTILNLEVSKKARRND